MNYWLVCLPREDLLHCLKIGIFGLKRKHTISQVQTGDRVVYVATREMPWKVIALGETTSDYYLDDEPVFKADGHFVDRFNFIATKLSPELSFKTAIPNLSVITKPQYWTVYFKNGIVKISSADWQWFCKMAGFEG